MPGLRAAAWQRPLDTWRVCLNSRHAVVLAAVSAPYQHAAGQRHVVSQRERDLVAIELERRRGVMLAQLGELADDDRLHPESVPVVGWYTAEVRAARTETRLDELADLASGPDSGIRRRHWWQSQPAGLVLVADDDDQDDEPDDGHYRAEVAAPSPLAIAPPRHGVHVLQAPGQCTTAGCTGAARHVRDGWPLCTRCFRGEGGPPTSWADALAANGWRLHGTPGGCQIIDSREDLCGDTENPYQIADRYGRAAWICWAHMEPLKLTMSALRRSS